MGLSNYPPGVSGNEPEITGMWPCGECDGEGGERDEDGVQTCPRCEGSGIEPEEFSLSYIEYDLLPRDYVTEEDLLFALNSLYGEDTKTIRLRELLKGRLWADYGKEGDAK